MVALCNGRESGRRLPHTIAGHAPHFAKGPECRIRLKRPAKIPPVRCSWTHLAVCGIRRHGVSGRVHRGVQTEPILQVVAFGMRCASI
jgi:hypothetical protein